MEIYSCVFFTFSLPILLVSLNFAKAAETGLPRAKADCGQVILKAEARTNYATTPGFPNPFPGDAKCIWAIYSDPGKRIRLEFQKFFLLQPVAGKCEYHYVIVKSPFTLFTMGPYCGETGLPTVVSTGNLIYVELHTLVPVTTDNYEGFKLAFKETLESSSYELRPDNSAEDEVVTIDPDTMNFLSPTVPTTTAPRTTKSTTKPWRFRPSRKPLQNRNRRPVIARQPNPPPQRERPPNFAIDNNRGPPQNTRILKPKTKNQQLRIEIIVAIAVGGLIAVAIIIMVGYKMMSKKKSESNKKKKDDDKHHNQANEKGETGEQQLPLPGMYPDRNQEHFAYDPYTAYPMVQMVPRYVDETHLDALPPPYDATFVGRKKTKSTRHQRRDKRSNRNRRKHRR